MIEMRCARCAEVKSACLCVCYSRSSRAERMAAAYNPHGKSEEAYNPAHLPVAMPESSNVCLNCKGHGEECPTCSGTGKRMVTFRRESPFKNYAEGLEPVAEYAQRLRQQGYKGSQLEAMVEMKSWALPRTAKATGSTSEAVSLDNYWYMKKDAAGFHVSNGKLWFMVGNKVLGQALVAFLRGEDETAKEIRKELRGG